ncbi:uncharacterized protein OCT59_006999 [Rhizophagus irregularis]|uniref:Cla4p n=2 Tax=Rhizophagus irregularis TaxID=588596 RepID=A0A015J223_RHIIW|nr:Cla4p [Rhizophagus irregularis DAOM 197198w]UZO15582.1 hypothetical protein OCT59_006999 [Rhizophagus irregularis]
MENIEDNMENMKDDIENSCTSSRCPECGNKFYYYCKPCNFAHFNKIDKLIQNSQPNANYRYKLIKWIEYSNLKNIEFVAHGGFGSVYKAIWKGDPIEEEPYSNINKSKVYRNCNKKVAIKKFRNATSISSEFLNEVRNNLELNYGYCNLIYGVTRDPQNGEFAIVIEFQNDGNIRELVKKSHSILNWKLIVFILIGISNGLCAVHSKNYHHRDFHSGNILNSTYGGRIYSVISDFGLCCPANQNSVDKTLYGVLPFVAPEVLRGGEFTKAADIYGFGMLMSELISGEAPFIDRDYDLHLALDICKGERPPIPEYTPEPYAALMKRCWDPIPTNRPSVYELGEKIAIWCDIIHELSHSRVAMKQEIEKEFSREREDRWKARLAELATKPFSLKKSQNMLTSKQLDYSKQLTQLLEAKDVEMETNDNSTLYNL